MVSPSDKANKSPVKIRFKELADGIKSIYLDIYVKGKRSYEFLKLYIHPGDDEETALANAEALRMAEDVRQERLARLGNPGKEVPASALIRENPADDKTAKARARAKRISREPVTLRVKDLKDGRQSLYLDIYFRRERKYEFLKLYLNPGEDEANAAVMKQAEAIRLERMAEIVKPEDMPVAEPEQEKKNRHKFKVILAFRLLRNGDKSYYLYIRYGENGEKRCCEPLYLYVAANASETEDKRARSRAKAVKREREEELRNGTFYPRASAREPKNVFDDTDHYKEFKEKRNAETEISAETVELKRNSKSKEPVRIRFKRLAGKPRLG